jgi:CRP-like cAMP-binding protein
VSSRPATIAPGEGVVPMVVRLHEPEPLPLTILRPGAVAVFQGAPGTGVTEVEAGYLRATAIDDHGCELLVDVLGPRDAVGEPLGASSPWTLRAVGPVRLRHVTGPRAAEAIARRSERLVAHALDLAWLDVTARIERRLRDLGERIGLPEPGGLVVPVRLTQDDLALMTGTTRESANRAVRTLEARDVIRTVRRARYLVRVPLHSVSEARPM